METAQPGALLAIKDLSIGFSAEGGTRPAVEALSLEIRRGEIVALVGESGSGKSITALSILRLLPSPPAVYTGGHIWFSDNNPAVDLLTVAAINQYRGNRIGMIFQEPMSALNPVMRCGRQVAEVLMHHKGIGRKAAQREAISWLEKVRLPDPQGAFHKYPHELSGGQKQRVMIAMAICCQPALLICDEPTTALDVTVQQHILELIASLQQESGMGVLFITHDLGVVARIAHRAAVIYRGRLVEQAPTSQLFANPAHPYTRALLACRPAAHPKHERLPSVAAIMNHEPASNSGSALPPAAPGKVYVDVRQLEVAYPMKRNLWGRPTRQFKAVDGVSFQIRQGETMGLVGESGCGKTTLGRTLLRLVHPTAGSIRIGNWDIGALPPTAVQPFRKNVQLVFQDPFAALNPRLTIGDALEEPLLLQAAYRTRKLRRQRLLQLLDLVQLPSNATHRYPHEFSGGQRQRIVIARALAPGPAFLVCDESVSALDVSVQAQVLNLLNDLKKELGLTLLFISHDLAVVRYMSDRLMVMQQGKIVEAGDAEQVYRHPVHPYTEALLAAIPKI